jgi:hypothetical protein
MVEGLDQVHCSFVEQDPVEEVCTVVWSIYMVPLPAAQQSRNLYEQVLLTSTAGLHNCHGRSAQLDLYTLPTLVLHRLTVFQYLFPDLTLSKYLTLFTQPWEGDITFTLPSALW